MRLILGTPGLPWRHAQVAVGFSRQTVKRGCDADALRVLETLSSRYDVMQYGYLDYHPRGYPLFAIKSHGWRDAPRATRPLREYHPRILPDDHRGVSRQPSSNA